MQYNVIKVNPLELRPVSNSKGLCTGRIAHLFTTYEIGYKWLELPEGWQLCCCRYRTPLAGPLPFKETSRKEVTHY